MVPRASFLKANYKEDVLRLCCVLVKCMIVMVVLYKEMPLKEDNCEIFGVNSKTK